MSSGGGGGEKTEKASPQRMKEVRKDGKLSRSRDLSAWVGLGAAALALPMVGSRATDAARDQLVAVRGVVADPDEGSALRLLCDALGSVLGTLAPIFLAVVVTVVVTGAAQGGVHPKKLKPQVKQLNPVSGLKRIFGAQALWEAAKTLLKTAVVALVLYISVQSLVPQLMGAGRLPLPHILGTASGGVRRLLLLGIGAGILMALADLGMVVRRNRKHTRMSRQEVKEEHKRTEGDPHLKSAIRSKQMAVSRNRMMAAVADADVVVVNPVHVAVALRYRPGTGAPRVVAKGTGAVAERIRGRATEHRVPMVQDITLARALHAACDLDQEVPAYLFTAVATVLAFVLALQRRGAAAGRHTLPGGPTATAAPADAPTTVPAVRARARAERAITRGGPAAPAA